MQLTVFELNKRFFAIESSHLREVHDPVSVTPLPFCPAFLDGLVNVGGTIMPQVDLALRMSMSDGVAVKTGCLLVIKAAQSTFALHADRARIMIDVDESEIKVSNGGDIHATLHGDLENLNTNDMVAGHFYWGKETVLLLNPVLLGLQGIESTKELEKGTGLLGSATPQSEDKVSSMFECFVFQARQENYALPLEDIIEVVNSSELTPLPGAPAEVLGLASIRGRGHIVLSTARLLESQVVEESEQWVLVERGGVKLVLAVDKIIGIQRFDSSVSQELMESDSSFRGYILGEDEQMIGYIQLKGLINDHSMASYQSFLSNDVDIEEIESESSKTDSYLSFSLGGERCAVPLETVASVHPYAKPQQAPNSDDRLCGVINITGIILPVIDLRIEMGRHSMFNSLTAYMVVSLDDSKWALIVDQVHRVMDVSRECVQEVSSSESHMINRIAKVDDILMPIVILDDLKTVSHEI